MSWCLTKRYRVIIDLACSLSCNLLLRPRYERLLVLARAAVVVAFTLRQLRPLYPLPEMQLVQSLLRQTRV